jgi:hypothetical protein
VNRDQRCIPTCLYVQNHLRVRCEVSEHATHCSSPHGPCKSSARITGRARTYATDLPKQDSMLPEAASERDQRSPHQLSPPSASSPSPVSLAIRAHSSTGYDPYPTIGTLDAFLRCNPLCLPILHGLCSSLPSIQQQDTTGSSCGAWTTFPLFHFQTISRTGQTYRVPDADPSDKAEVILTQPVPHFTRCID